MEYTLASVSVGCDVIKFLFEGGTGYTSIYYDNGKMRATGYVNSDAQLDGILTGYREEDGSLRYEANFIKGELDTIRSYREDGTLEYEATHKDGQEHGVKCGYYSNGNLAEKVMMDYGWTSYTIESYYENGNIEFQGVRGTGKTDGIERSFYENGNLKSEVPIVNGEQHGVFREYYENGNLRGEVSYENGTPEGTKKEYYENGNLKCEISYLNYKKQGLAKWYQENGEMIVEITYQYGKAISGRCCKNNKQLTSAHLHRMDKEGVIESDICS